MAYVAATNMLYVAERLRQPGRHRLAGLRVRLRLRAPASSRPTRRRASRCRRGRSRRASRSRRTADAARRAGDRQPRARRQPRGGDVRTGHRQDRRRAGRRLRDPLRSRTTPRAIPRTRRSGIGRASGTDVDVDARSSQIDVSALTSQTIAVGKEPEDMAFLDARYMVVANGLSDSLSIIDRPASMVAATVPLGTTGLEPTSLAYDAAHARLYATLASANAIAGLRRGRHADAAQRHARWGASRRRGGRRRSWSTPTGRST